MDPSKQKTKKRKLNEEQRNERKKEDKKATKKKAKLFMDEEELRMFQEFKQAKEEKRLQEEMEKKRQDDVQKKKQHQEAQLKRQQKKIQKHRKKVLQEAAQRDEKRQQLVSQLTTEEKEKITSDIAKELLACTTIVNDCPVNADYLNMIPFVKEHIIDDLLQFYSTYDFERDGPIICKGEKTFQAFFDFLEACFIYSTSDFEWENDNMVDEIWGVMKNNIRVKEMVLGLPTEWETGDWDDYMEQKDQTKLDLEIEREKQKDDHNQSEEEQVVDSDESEEQD